jgi:uncharacterized membrane protein
LVAILSVLAVVELVADKLPQTSSRTAPPGLIARIVTGGLTGACVAAAGSSGSLIGGFAGADGGITGCFLGHQGRVRLIRAAGTRIFTLPCWKIFWQ